MLEQDFMPVQSFDWVKIQKYLDLCHYEEENHNIINMMMWMEWYPLFYYEQEHYLLLLSIHEGEFFMLMPLCKPEYFEEAVLKGKEIFDYYEHPFVMEWCLKEQAEQVERILSGYKMVETPEYEDYVYECEKLRTFSGKALQKKRNHLNAFYRENEGHWTYETLDRHNIEETKEYLLNWKNDDPDYHLQEEKSGTCKILDMFGVIPYRGGIIRIDGKVRAFAIGSVLSERMCQENIEKADSEVRGLYQAIMKEWLVHEMSEFQYVDREDDFGSENLRHAKQAYNPIFMIPKYRICKEDGND